MLIAWHPAGGRLLDSDMQVFREHLERNQIVFYFAAVLAGVAIAMLLPSASTWEPAINPALAFMLYVTFLQVPIAELRQAFTRMKFLGALLVSNFIVVPLLVAGLIQLLPPDPMVRLGVLFVLLTPCIDYVVTFSHLGRADARLLLASTPVLLGAQMLLLPAYLKMFLGNEAGDLVQLGPFIHAFIWLIAVPLGLAAITQAWAKRSHAGEKIAAGLGLLCVPATALVLLIVVAAVLPQLGVATEVALSVIPIYIGFAVLAPLAGWYVSRLFNLEAEEGRAVAFSSSTRNSLVILPLALAVPGAIPILPAVIVTQTMVELVSELIYIRTLSRLGA